MEKSKLKNKSDKNLEIDKNVQVIDSYKTLESDKKFYKLVILGFIMGLIALAVALIISITQKKVVPVMLAFDSESKRKVEISYVNDMPANMVRDLVKKELAEYLYRRISRTGTEHDLFELAKIAKYVAGDEAEYLEKTYTDLEKLSFPTHRIIKIKQDGLSSSTSYWANIDITDLASNGIKQSKSWEIVIEFNTQEGDDQDNPLGIKVYKFIAKEVK